MMIYERSQRSVKYHSIPGGESAGPRSSELPREYARQYQGMNFFWFYRLRYHRKIVRSGVRVSLFLPATRTTIVFTLGATYTGTAEPQKPPTLIERRDLVAAVITRDKLIVFALIAN
jgi:hypothetical protein